MADKPFPRNDNTAPGREPETVTEDRLSAVRDIPIDLRCVLGEAKLAVRDLMTLGEGSTIELTKLAGGPEIELVVNGNSLGHGSAVMFNDSQRLGVKIVVWNPSTSARPSAPRRDVSLGSEGGPRLTDDQPDPAIRDGLEAESMVPQAPVRSHRQPVSQPAEPTTPTMQRDPELPAMRPAPSPTLPVQRESPRRQPVTRLGTELSLCADEAARIDDAGALTPALRHLPEFVPSLELVLQGQPARYTTTSGEPLDMADLEAWVEIFTSVWLNRMCVYLLRSIEENTQGSPGPTAVRDLLRRLQDAVLRPLAAEHGLEVLIYLEPRPLDTERMKVIGTLPSGGQMVVGQRSCGLIARRRLVRPAGVILG